MKKKNIASKPATKRVLAVKSTWKHRRDMLSKTIPLEVDLENRQIFFDKCIDEKLNLVLNTTNLDSMITSYLHPNESKKVMQRLSKAEKGLEKPIPFQFVHPLTDKTFHFEYHYKIVYVKYASTRLQGELIKSRPKRTKKI